MVQPETKAKENVTEVDGVRILDGRYAMSAEGKVLSPSSQNMAQLKAELTARSLSTEGKRDVLKRRVMVSFVSCLVCLHVCMVALHSRWKRKSESGSLVHNVMPCHARSLQASTSSN